MAIKLSVSPDHLIASFKLTKVSSVVNDFEDTIKRVSSGVISLVLYSNSNGSDPVIKSNLKEVF